MVSLAKGVFGYFRTFSPTTIEGLDLSYIPIGNRQIIAMCDISDGSVLNAVYF